MREARIVVPANSSGALIALSKAIVDAFGGYTTFSGHGAWTSKSGWILSEYVVIYDIAYEPSWETDAKLFDIADAYRVEAKQEEVYLRYGNGNVRFVKANDCMNNGEKEPFEWERLRLELNEPAEDITDIVEHAEHVAI